MVHNDLETRTQSSDRPGRFAALKPVLHDAVVPLAAFYLLRFIGLDLVTAYACAAAVGLARVAITGVKDRRFNAIAGLITAILTLQLILVAIAGDLRIALLADSVSTGVIGLVLLGSCLIGAYPGFHRIALRTGGDTTDRRLALQRRWETEPTYRHTMTVLTIGCGVLTITEALVRVILVFSLSPDTMVGVSKVLQFGVVAVIVVWARWYGKRRRTA